MTLFAPDGSLLTRRPSHGILMARPARRLAAQHTEWVITCKCEREVHLLLRPARMDCWRVGPKGRNSCRVIGEACWKARSTSGGLVIAPALMWRGHFSTTEVWHLDDPGQATS